MLNEKTAAVVGALMLLNATVALGATNVIVNGSGIVANTQPAIETELIIGQSGTPANIMVITQANEYCLRGTVNSSSITTDDSTSVQFSGTLPGSGTFDAKASTTNDPNIWTLQILQITGNPSNAVCRISAPTTLTLSGHLQIIPP